ncbi:PAS domain-containing protein [Pararhizobium sp. IMCC21322]|uniref:PAS domain-containing protein n=1 Tax=Pararhizobium sp. IMCC21322 TaxID=3067903 RepID=UPI00274043D9|nr:PAS domain-containing protein [Pararhizobium sp. IMCC21322]
MLRLRRADGKMRFVQAVASVELDANQSTKTVYGIFRDVTQSASEKAISKNRAQLVTSMIANSPSPIAILDRKLCYLQLSPAWLEYHGLKNPKSYIGKSHYAAIPEIPQKWREEHQRVLRGETIYRSQSIQKRETTLESGACMFP